jgi:uncharacterized protein YndB with AHSA1/START domain
MTTPDVPLRLEFSFELEATPERVWDAIATGPGLNSWFLPTDIEEREGGAVAFHMGDTSSEGSVTGWDPPRRLVYEEPDWAALSGHEDASVTPMVSEFLVEARSGGTCVLRVVTSAFGIGADWENEFFEEMSESWKPFFDNLRIYLTDFPGQRATSFEASTTVTGGADAAVSAMRRALVDGGDGEDSIEANGLAGRVHREDPSGFLVRLTEPLPGYMAFYAFGGPDDSTNAAITGWLFSDDAPAYVERERPAWTAWLENLALPAS